MDCDDVMLLLAAREQRTLTGMESTRLETHVAECAVCQALAEVLPDDAWRVLVKVPNDAFDDRDLLVLPVVDPIVFSGGTEISKGGMGRIVKAHDRRLGREVAIKETLEANLRHRFEREVAITARLQHPAIVPIYEAGAWPDGTVFYTMRLVPGGRTLGHAIDEATTMVDRLKVLPHVIAATEAMAYAHSQGVIHRDLKPANVLVGGFGETVLIDWGLAKEIGRDDGKVETRTQSDLPDLTLAGTVIGTPCFMSPEQAAGKLVDERDDVYALGAILYHLLAGEPPYWDSVEKKSAQLIVEVTLLRPPTRIAEQAPDAPADLIEIVERAMARDREQRFENAGAMAAELARFTAGKLLATREYSMVELIGRWVKRHRAAVGVGALAVVALAVVGTLAIVNVASSRAEEHVARMDAEAANAKSQERVGDLLEEQGRVEWLAGEPERALVYLAEAYRHGRNTVALRHLLGATTRDLGLLLHHLPTGSTAAAVGSLDDGRIVTASNRPGSLAIWKSGVRESVHDIEASVWRLEISATGREVITVRDDKLAMVDSRTGARRWEVPLGFTEVANIELDPRGASIVVDEGAKTGRTDVRDFATGALRKTLTTGTWASDARVFSPDGTRLAIGGSDHVVRVWNTTSYELVGSLPLEHGIRSLAFVGPDRVVAGSDRVAYLWTIGSQKPIELAGHYDLVSAIAVSAKRDLIATGDLSGSVRMWDAAGRPIGESRALIGWIGRLAFSPDDGLLAGAGTDTRVALWDRELFVVRMLPAFRSSSYAIAWSADGMQLVTSGTYDDDVRVWQRPATNRIARVRMGEYAMDGRRLLVSDDDGTTLRDSVTGQALQKLPVALRADWFGTVQLGDDGKRALVESRPGSYGIYDLATNTALAMFSTHASDGGTEVLAAAKIILSADGRFVVEHDVEGRARTRVFDAATGKLVRELPVGGIVAITADGERIAGLLHDVPAIWRLSTGDRIPLPQATALAGARFPLFGRRGDRIAVFGDHDTVVVDTITGAIVATLHGRPGNFVTTARFVDDDHRIVATTTERVATMWNAVDGTILITADDALDCTATDDGARLATGSVDGTLRIWDVATRRLLEELRGHRKPIDAMTFSHDGQRLVARDTGEGGKGGYGTIWDVALETRPSATIDDVLQRVPWKFDGGFVVPR